MMISESNIHSLDKYFHSSKTINKGKSLIQKHNVSRILPTPDLGQKSPNSAFNSPMIVDEAENNDNDCDMATEESYSDRIYFANDNKGPSELMIQALSSLQNKKFEPKWVSEADIEKIAREKAPIIVIDTFDGSLFKKISSIKNARIFSPFAIIQCNPRDTLSLPYRRHPVQNLCMRECYITCSNLSHATVLSIKSKVAAMGGRFSFHLRKQNNYIVSNTWSTRKCLNARSDRIHVMSVEWVEKCWELSGKGFDVKELQLAKYKLPIFAGMHICASGFTTSEKIEIRNAVQNNGGIYSGSLFPDRTTHLIVRNANGEKFECAKNKGIHIINKDWLDKSIESGFPVLEYSFTMTDQAIIPKIPKTTDSTECVTKNVAKPVTRVERVVDSQAPFDEMAGRINKLYLEITNRESLFDGFTFFICGFPEVVLGPLRELIKKVGGAVYHNLVPPISHVVVGTKLTRKEAYTISKFEEKKSIVKVGGDWIIECVRKSTLLDEYIDPECEGIFNACSTQDLPIEARKRVFRQRFIEKSDQLNKIIQEAKLRMKDDIEPPQEPKKGFKIGAPQSTLPKLCIRPIDDEQILESIPISWVGS